MTQHKRVDSFKSKQTQESNKRVNKTESASTTDTLKTQTSKYKTELCKNVVQFGGCRYGKNCRFAHNYDELAAHQAALEAEEVRRKANKNCKSFFAVKFCHHGANCAYRHEYRGIEQIHRYYYV